MLRVARSDHPRRDDGEGWDVDVVMVGGTALSGMSTDANGYRRAILSWVARGDFYLADGSASAVESFAADLASQTGIDAA